MEATILDAVPLSGQYPEVNFHPQGNCMWVRFVDNDYKEWVGVFGRGGSSKNRVTFNSAKQLALVVAASSIYLIDVAARKEKWSKNGYMGWGCMGEDALLVPESEEILYADYLKIQVWNQAGDVVWATKRISWDGITFDSFDGRVMRGMLNDLSPKGVPYSFDVFSRELKSSWVYKEPKG